VQFYESDDVLVDAVGAYLAAGLRSGEAAIVVATAAHRAGLAAYLAAAGLDLAVARTDGHYLALDAAETMAQFLVDGMPDPGRFTEVIGGLIAEAGAAGRRVRIFGEMVALLALDGNRAATTRLEALWNELQATRSFVLVCAYPIQDLGGEPFADLVYQVCAEHSRVIPAESYAALTAADDRDRAVTVLQQKARSLELALTAERAARDEAEAALRLRDEFLSIAAHELRTPLTTLSGRAELALRLAARAGESVPAPVVQSLRAISGQTGKLARLVGHLLDVSRLDAGRLALERQPTDLVALVRAVVSEARTWTDRHVIAVSAPPAVEAVVDPLRLEQVLVNLLENAVKYSPDGGPIEVAIAWRGAAVEVSVRDQGLGISPDQREAVFERFAQAHADSHRSGLGLGLYICRQIVHLHGGEIVVESTEGTGSVFTVRLPCQALRPR
jgi:signal transduction histidine kinase